MDVVIVGSIGGELLLGLIGVRVVSVKAAEKAASCLVYVGAGLLMQ